ncbi:MAG: hypothetical protein WA143_08085 [Lutibacter sp.]
MSASKIMHNRLVQISSLVFSLSVTYLIPIIAIFWGLLDGEKISFLQFFSGFVILVGDNWPIWPNKKRLNFLSRF